jgi:hypothetical protein
VTKSDKLNDETRRGCAFRFVTTLAFVAVLGARDARAGVSSPPQTAALSSSGALLTLAENAGFTDLTDCERKLLESAPIGKFALCQSLDAKVDPSKGDQWPESVKIRPKLIRWLCVNESARKLIDPKGIKIYGAKIADNLDLESVSVPFALDLQKSRFSAGLSLRRAKIVGELNLLGSFLANPEGPALNANGAYVTSDVFLSRGFNSRGEVDLTAATIGGGLQCDGGTFSNPNGMALNVNRANITGSVFLWKGFNSTGEVNLGSATIGSELVCSGAIFGKGSKFVAENASVTRLFWWSGIGTESKGAVVAREPLDIPLDLFGLRVGTWLDDEKSWPPPGKLNLDGFRYDRLEMMSPIVGAGAVPRDGDSGLRFVRLQNSSTGLATQPYEQLAGVLQSEGQDRAARKVRIALEDDLRARLPWYRQIWPWILRYTIAYGYEPWLALWWAALVVLFGYLSFSLGYRAGVIAPTDKDAFADFQADSLPPNYQSFNAFVYSLDTFLPIINLGIKDRWMPDPNLRHRAKALTGTWLGDWCGSHFPQVADQRFFKSGRSLRVYFWCHLLLGWALITLFAAGFTGIVHH